MREVPGAWDTGTEGPEGGAGLCRLKGLGWGVGEVPFSLFSVWAGGPHGSKNTLP